MSNPYKPENPEILFTKPKKKKNRYFLHLGLFLLTFLTLAMAGTAWMLKDPYYISEWHYGLTYAFLMIIFISAHEFGHYFAARHHKVDSTLPYYIPLPPDIMPFGTMGAVIKTRSPISSKKALFDIGVAGPVAGFVVALAYLIIGFITLPPIDYIYEIIPEYKYLFSLFGVESPTIGLYYGDTLLFSGIQGAFANPNGWLPPMNEILHYPLLNAGWFGLFVTSLNMLPIGQLDGGHVSYAMFGRKQYKIARYVWWFIFILGIGGVLNIIRTTLQFDDPNSVFIFLQAYLLPALDYFNDIIPAYFQCWPGWLFWALITKFFIKLPHPPLGIYEEGEKLSRGRMAMGWFAFAILLLSFSYNGIYFL